MGKGAACTQKEQDKWDENDPNWGKVERFDGSNIPNFLPDQMENDDYLLLFWHQLEEKNLVQLILVKLQDGVAACSDQFVSIVLTGYKKRQNTNQTKLSITPMHPRFSYLIPR